MERDEKFKKILLDLQAVQNKLSKIIFSSLAAFFKEKINRKELEEIWGTQKEADKILKRVTLSILEVGTEEMKQELYNTTVMVAMKEEIFSKLPDRTGLNMLLNTSLTLQEGIENLQGLIVKELSSRNERIQ